MKNIVIIIAAIVLIVSAAILYYQNQDKSGAIGTNESQDMNQGEPLSPEEEAARELGLPAGDKIYVDPESGFKEHYVAGPLPTTLSGFTLGEKLDPEAAGLIERTKYMEPYLDEREPEYYKKYGFSLYGGPPWKDYPNSLDVPHVYVNSQNIIISVYDLLNELEIINLENDIKTHLKKMMYQHGNETEHYVRYTAFNDDIVLLARETDGLSLGSISITFRKYIINDKRVYNSVVLGHEKLYKCLPENQLELPAKPEPKRERLFK